MMHSLGRLNIHILQSELRDRKANMNWYDGMRCESILQLPLTKIPDGISSTIANTGCSYLSCRSNNKGIVRICGKFNELFNIPTVQFGRSDHIHSIPLFKLY